MTRIGLLADVHGNLPALEAGLAALDRAGVDAFACAGDLVGYGPHPNECVLRVTELPGACVVGNHDLMALGELPLDGAIPLAQDAILWTRRVLTPDARRRLAELPRTARPADGVLLAHGSPDDPETYVRSPAQALAVLARAREHAPPAQIVVLGHTHAALAVGEDAGLRLAGGTGTIALAPGERHLLNPGSVGQSRERRVRARVAVLDLGARVVEFHALAYDTARCRRALRAHGLPPSSHHLRPRRWRRPVAAATRRAAALVASGRRRSRPTDGT